MNTEKTPLSATQRQAAEILAMNDIHGKTVAQIAEELGVSERTIYRWKNDPAFIAYQNEIAEKLMTEFIAEAYTELRKLVRLSDSENTRLKAIELTLKNRGKLKDVQEKTVDVTDQRSNDAIRADIEALKQKLGV